MRNIDTIEIEGTLPTQAAQASASRHFDEEQALSLVPEGGGLGAELRSAPLATGPPS